MKSNFTARLFRWSHQLPDRFENCSDVLVISIDTPFELEVFLAGGILPFTLRRLARSSES